MYHNTINRSVTIIEKLVFYLSFKFILFIYWIPSRYRFKKIYFKLLH